MRQSEPPPEQHGWKAIDISEKEVSECNLDQLRSTGMSVGSPPTHEPGGSMKPRDRDYYAARAAEEHVAAEKATDPDVARVHRDMAALYLSRTQRPDVPPGRSND